MVVMTDEEVIASLKKNAWASGITVVTVETEHSPHHNLIYEDIEANCIYISLRGDRRDAFVAQTLALLGTDWNEAMFYGAWLWITLFSIGSPQLERTGWMQIELMRRAFGELRTLEVARGHWFRNGQVVELAAFLTVCIEFGWDAWLVPAGEQFFIRVSHDEYAVIATRDEKTYEKCMGELKNLDPQSGGHMVERFCPNSRHIDQAVKD